MNDTTIPTLKGFSIYSTLGSGYLLYKAWCPEMQKIGRFLRLHADGTATFHASKMRDAEITAFRADVDDLRE